MPEHPARPEHAALIDTDLVARSVLCWLATSSVDGQPRVSPKQIFTVIEDRRLLIANIASPGSARNIAAHPRVCVSVLDIFTQKGQQLMGSARCVSRKDPDFEALAAPLRTLAGERFPFGMLFDVAVDAAQPILAPSYRLFPDTAEADQVVAALADYGVEPGPTFGRIPGKGPGEGAGSHGLAR